MLMYEVSGFKELADRLKGLPDQTIGLPCHVCETGEPYQEFFSFGLARPDDVAVVERAVAGDMSKRLDEYLNSRGGRIYWRIPFEWEITQKPVVVRYDENGPDKDPVMDRKCVMDKNWLKVACYCRVYRAAMRLPGDIEVKVTLPPPATKAAA